MNIHPPGLTLGPLREEFERRLAALEQERAMERMWDRDHTLWKEEPGEIVDRLGWLRCPTAMADRLPEITAFAGEVRAAGHTRALLLGMGGSSLAAEVLRSTFGVREGCLDLRMLDSTNPDAVRAIARELDPASTLFIAATKSGSTVETISLLKYFYRRAAAALGAEAAGAHFAAITDPGSGLADMGAELGFRHIFLNDPEIGGRYSALSCFGLVPAALIGVDLEGLLRRAADAAAPGCTTGLLLGAALGAGARCGRDKLTLICSPSIAGLGAWIEQLVAESTGKEGRGILPVEGEEPGPPGSYGKDRLFVYLRLRGDHSRDREMEALAAAGLPVVRLDLNDRCDLGGAFFHWEIGTSLAAHCLRVNPFDQPDVEAAKALARTMADAFRGQGRLPSREPVVEEDGLTVYGEAPASSLTAALQHLLTSGRRAGGPGYIALQAYLCPGPRTEAALQELRLALRQRTRLATTIGYGPSFLHSTGQLHKGDAGKGLFIQLTCDPAADVPIPDEPRADASTMSFGVLAAAQAMGDRQALVDAGRRVLRIHLGKDAHAGLRQVLRALP